MVIHYSRASFSGEIVRANLFVENNLECPGYLEKIFKMIVSQLEALYEYYDGTDNLLTILRIFDNRTIQINDTPLFIKTMTGDPESIDYDENPKIFIQNLANGEKITCIIGIKDRGYECLVSFNCRIG